MAARHGTTSLRRVAALGSPATVKRRSPGVGAKLAVDGNGEQCQIADSTQPHATAVLNITFARWASQRENAESFDRPFLPLNDWPISLSFKGCFSCHKGYWLRGYARSRADSALGHVVEQIVPTLFSRGFLSACRAPTTPLPFCLQLVKGANNFSNDIADDHLVFRSARRQQQRRKEGLAASRLRGVPQRIAERRNRLRAFGCPGTDYGRRLNIVSINSVMIVCRWCALRRSRTIPRGGICYLLGGLLPSADDLQL